jgi:uncharacterized protein (DUF1501 family)
VTTIDERACGCPENQRAALTRRSLFRFAAGAGLVTATTLSGARVAFGAEGSTGTGTLVVLSLRGGFDGLSAVAPIGDPEYAKNRPGTQVTAAVAKRVDATFGLHPAMKPLFGLWDAGHLGAVHAVGQVNPTRSHFAAMEEMERAAPHSPVRTGWIDRTLGVVGSSSVFTGTQVGNANLPASLLGPHPKFAMSDINGVKLAVGEDLVPLQRWRSALATLHQGSRREVRAPIASALRAVSTIRPLQQPDADPVAAGYPDGGLGRALFDTARLVKAGVGLRVASVEYGDWDMHSGMGSVGSGWMVDRLGELSAAMAAFARHLGSDFPSVTLLTLSEFGRRVQENGSNGLDHGHGNAVLVMGGNIRGGAVRGRWPGLAPDALVDGDLAGTTDYRSIVSEVLAKRLGLTGTGPVFPGFRPRPVGIV